MKKILLFLYLIASTLALHAQNNFWEEAKGPYGGNFTITPTDTNVVYARDNNSLYRSEDFGEHWEQIFVAAADSLGASEENIFIGTSGTFYAVASYHTGGANYVYNQFVSDNEGQTWSLLNNTPNVLKSVYETPSGVLIGLDPKNRQIFRSIDAGINWIPVFTSSFPSLLTDPNMSTTNDGKILLSELYNNDFAYSEDDGQTWVEGETPHYQSNNSLASSGTIFATSKGPWSLSDLFRSTNGGVSWDSIPFNSNPALTLNNVISLNNGNLLLSTNRNLYVSMDEGLTWDSLPITTEQATQFSLHKPLSNGALLGIHKDALVRSSNEGDTWSFSAFGMHRAIMDALIIPSAQEQFAVTLTGLWKTTDRGENWTRILTDTSTSSLNPLYPLALINQDSFAVTQGLNIWGTTDGGQTFNDLTPAGGLSKGRVLATPSGYLFCTGPEGALKTFGLGNSWTLSMPNEYMLQLVEHPSGDLFATSYPLDNSSSNYRLWRSSNKGDTWEEVTSLAIPPADRSDLQIDHNGKLYVMGYYDHALKLAISEDGTGSWVYKTIPLSQTTWMFNVNDQGQLFVINPINSPYRVLSSADGGDSWYYLPDFPQGTFSVWAGIISADGHLYYQRSDGQLLRSKNPTQFGAYVRGEVVKDADMDCSTPDAQQPLKNWIIALEGENTYYAITNELGRYTIFADTGNYTVKAQIPQNRWWALCDSSQVIEANGLMNSDTVNFVALPLAACPLLSVNVAIPRLRRCFDNTVFVDYCNQGTETADSAWVDVQLDPFLYFISSAQPQEVLGNNTVRFFVGDVPSGECGQFQLKVYVNCDSTVLGQTHCVTAHGFPDTLCIPVPDWSGANIEATVTCQDTTLKFNLKNTGTSQSEILDYIIIEDDIVLLTGQESYDVSDELVLDFPANGKTWRIESAQEPGHPFSTLVLAFAEGCGGFNSLGYINQFPVNGTQPSWHTSCLENTGAYDPNDKQGFPLGCGDNHNIRPGQALDYLIRFQNTGTDTAFTVVIRDTLSPFLDPLSIRPGAGSHPYTWNLSGQGVLSFTFNQIMLPDSNVNEPASQGFVQFNISPYLTLPLGSVLENSAAIYFDFNEPVITNTTWHTIQTVSKTIGLSPEPKTSSPELEIWPNPFSEHTIFYLKQKTSGPILLKIFDSRGNLVAQKSASGPSLEWGSGELPTGVYWAEIRDLQGRLLGNGKLVKW